VVTKIVVTGYSRGVRAPGEAWVSISKRPQGCGFAVARLNVDDAALEQRAHQWSGQTIDVEAAPDAPDSCIVKAQAILARAGVLRIRLVPALPVVELRIPAGACRFEMDGREFSVDQPGKSPRDWSAFQVSIVGDPTANPRCIERVMEVATDWGVAHLSFGGK
jgi:hypothetical protein